MPKNIVICCDGTDNKLTINENTNVIHLYACLEKDDKQITYYHPGVGTIAPSGISSAIIRGWKTLMDKVSAGSLEDNVKDAYIFLMDNYEEGDEVYLFGFSRGAYTVRMLSGLIEMFGLIYKGNAGHLRYALEIYVKGDELFKMASAFKARFSQTIDIHFIGIWDTVVAAGGLINFYKNFPYSQSLGVAQIIRHAIAIDERRKHYDCYHVANTHSNCKEVFFAGVHSDVGGSYPQEGLSKVALEWMLGEAADAGLKLSKKKVDRYVYGKGSDYQPPDYHATLHNSLTLGFKIFDFVPRPRFKKDGWFFEMKLDWRIWPRRAVPADAMIHESVAKRFTEQNYRPRNLSADLAGYQIEMNTPIKY